MTHEEFVDEYNYSIAASTEELDQETLEALREILEAAMLANCESVVDFEINNQGRIKLLTIDIKSDTVE